MESAAAKRETCGRCHNLHKKCDSLRPKCTRCDKGHHTCDYSSPYAQRKKRATSNKPSSTQSSASSLEPALSLSPFTPTTHSSRSTVRTIDETFVPLNFGMTSADCWVLEDPNFIPTIQDWTLIHGYLSFRGSTLLALLDSQKFLESFFFEPPELSESVGFAYFEQAKKAMQRSQTPASVKKVQALVYQSNFASLSYGNPAVARPFFAEAVRMMFQLRLDVDPDNSPWLPPLSEEDKNERRILFWVIVYMIRIVTTVSNRSFPTPDIAQVKFSREVTFVATPNTPNRPFSTICYVSYILDAMSQATLHHKTIPASVAEILSCQQIPIIEQRLNTLKTELPTELLLSLSDASLARFLQLPHAQLAEVRVTDILMVTLLFNTTTCVIHRPMLYLTSVLQLTSPELMVPQNLTKLLNCLHTCVSAARTITALNTWVLNLSAVENRGSGGGPNRQNIFVKDTFAYFSLFEAAVVLWFVTCKTQHFWWKTSTPGDPLSMTYQDRKAIRSEVLDLLQTLRHIETVHSGQQQQQRPHATNHHHHHTTTSPNMMTPLVQCVAGMVEQMELVESLSPRTAHGLFEEEESLSGGGVDMIVLGMKALAVDTDDGSPSPPPKSRMDSPWVFLGLLGMDVGNMRWNGGLEHEWRLFWKRERHLRRGSVPFF
ncbi:hypothetical protein HDU98_006578 [Podochytrium sp. JEL0797]|nr:hypothetical protein HDU98_006578 [Podochytrium sp. JEL0797]